MILNFLLVVLFTTVKWITIDLGHAPTDENGFAPQHGYYYISSQVGFYYSFSVCSINKSSGSSVFWFIKTPVSLQCRNSKRHVKILIFILLILSGDVEMNPGPATRSSISPTTPTIKVNALCPECSKDAGFDSVACEFCDEWFHRSCIKMSDDFFSLLSTKHKDSVFYFCKNCSKNNFLAKVRKILNYSINAGIDIEKIIHEHQLISTYSLKSGAEVKNIIDFHQISTRKTFAETEVMTESIRCDNASTSTEAIRNSTIAQEMSQRLVPVPNLPPPSKSFTVVKGANHVLSNFFMFDFVLGKDVFKSLEHAYQATKAYMANLPKLAEEIIKCPTPQQAKQLGKQAKLPIGLCVTLMTQLLDLKLRQLPLFKKRLIETGTTPIYHSTYPNADIEWTTGLHFKDYNNHARRNFTGKNRFGALLESLRRSVLSDPTYSTSPSSVISCNNSVLPAGDFQMRGEGAGALNPPTLPKKTSQPKIPSLLHLKIPIPKYYQNIHLLNHPYHYFHPNNIHPTYTNLKHFQISHNYQPLQQHSPNIPHHRRRRSPLLPTPPNSPLLTPGLMSYAQAARCNFKQPRVFPVLETLV